MILTKKFSMLKILSMYMLFAFFTFIAVHSLNAAQLKPRLIVADGEHDKTFSTNYLVVDKSDSVEVKLPHRGGFAACLKPFDDLHIKMKSK